MKTLLNHTRRQAVARRRGFSLAEMMVVIVIIGLLATLVVPNVIRNLGQATATKIRSDLRTIAQSVDQYAMEHAMQYPDSLEELASPSDGSEGYFPGDKVPTDPWGMPYQYEPDGRNYDVYTLGADKSPGGEDENADIHLIEEE